MIREDCRANAETRNADLRKNRELNAALLTFLSGWGERAARWVAMRSGRWERPTSGQEVRTPRRFYGSGFSQSRDTVERSGWRRAQAKRKHPCVGAVAGVGEDGHRSVELDEDDAIVVAVRPCFSQRDRCPHCRRRCPGYDLGDGRQRWRALDLGTMFCVLEADAPRVSCKEHGVVVAAVR